VVSVVIEEALVVIEVDEAEGAAVEVLLEEGGAPQEEEGVVEDPVLREERKW
jgi:hypothetical protein